MWEFLLPLLVSTLSGGIGSAINAGSKESANQRTAEGAAAQRRSLQSVIYELRHPNYNGVDAQFMADLTRSLGQLTANDAKAGTSGGGRESTAMSDALTKGLAQLAQFKSGDYQKRMQELASIMQSPAFAAPNPDSFNPAAAATGGFFGGSLAGAGSALSAFLSTTGGTELLKQALGGGSPTLNPEQTYGSFMGLPSEGAIAPAQPKIDWGASFGSPTFHNPAFGA